MARPTAPFPSAPDHTTSDESSAYEIGDDSLVLSPDHVQRVAQFREAIRLCETDTEKYELCVQIRNELLKEHTGVQLLAAACEHVMFTQCVEYKDWKETKDQPSAKSTRPNGDDVAEWNRFFGVAKDGLEIKSKCLSALKTVAQYWGQDVVEHYQWAYKGRKYCDKLCAAAREVHDWEKAVTGLNRSMLERSQQGLSLRRRPVQASFNPIEQGDLDNLRKTPAKGLAIDLPAGFGFDKFGLMVQAEYAAMAPKTNGTDAAEPSLPTNGTDTTEHPLPTSNSDIAEPTLANVCAPNPPGRSTPVVSGSVMDDVQDDEDDIVDEVVRDFLAESGAVATGVGDTTAAQELPVHTGTHSTDNEKGVTGRAGRELRARTQPTYKESGGRTPSKPKHQPKPAKVSNTTKPCCPTEAPLSILDNPSTFQAEHATIFTPYLARLCHPHLQTVAELSANALAKAGTSRPIPDAGPADCVKSSPGRRRAASLPDFTQQPPLKQPRHESYTTLSGGAGIFPAHNQVGDEFILQQVLALLKEKLERTGRAERTRRSERSRCKSHGEIYDELTFNILQKSKQPNTDRSRGAVEMHFLTEDETASLIESKGWDLNIPILTNGQQHVQSTGPHRPIALLCRFLEDGLDRTVSVQIPSLSSKGPSYETRTLRQVRDRFLGNTGTDDPWNVLDLANPLPPTTPSFLTGENSQLLPRIRDTALMGTSAERPWVSSEQWNTWKTTGGVLLSQGGHSAGPHTDSIGQNTQISVQEGHIVFGWMSYPTPKEREMWQADQSYTGGRWRYSVVGAGQRIVFGGGLIHVVSRLEQVLAVFDHFLLWSGLDRWIQIVIAQMRNPATTNEDMTWTAPQYVHAAQKLVVARMESGRAETLGGEAVARRFLALVEEFTMMLNQRKKLPG